MEKCVSCHGINGEKMTPWKFNDRGHERFEDIDNHSVFIHNDISREMEPKVLREYGLSSNQFNIKLSHVEGYNIKYYLNKEFPYEDSVLQWLKYIAIVVIIFVIFLKYNQIMKRKKEQRRLLDEAKKHGFDSIEEYEKHQKYIKLEAEAKRNGFDSVDEYQEHLRKKARERLEAEAKRNGFSSVEEYQKHLNEKKRQEKEEKARIEKEKQDQIKKEREERENAPTVITKVYFRPSDKSVFVITKKGEKQGKFTIPVAMELINWTSSTVTIRHCHNPKLICTFNANGKQIDDYIEV